jgi:hypothetical protein
MAAIVKRLIRQIKGDPTSYKSEQRFHGEKCDGENSTSCNSGQMRGLPYATDDPKRELRQASQTA